MPRPRIHSDEAILKATRACLLERGPAAPISAIAKKLGTSAPVVLARFGSRAALVQAALSPPSPADLLALLRREPSAEAFPAQLEELLHSLAGWYEQTTTNQLLLRLSAPSQRPRQQQPQDQLRVQPSLTIWLARAGARGLTPPGNPQLLSSAIIHALQGWSLADLLDGGGKPPSRDALVTQLAALVIR
jgi:AcrR family transcriptional regulator